MTVLQHAIDRLMPIRHPDRAWQLLFACALGALCVNTFWFTVQAANPLITSDTWHYLGSLILPYSQGDFSIGDLFSKRNAMDHSQPLRKLILLANYEWFGLDLMFGAVVGVLAAFVGLAVLWSMVRSARGVGRQATSAEYLVFIALAAGYLSLSARVVFSWPLLTTSFTNHFFIFMFAWAAWRALTQPDWRRLSALLVAGFALSVVADDTGLLTTIALLLATLLHGLRTKQWRAVLRVVAVCVLAYGLYAVFYKVVSSTPAAGTAALPLASRLEQLGAQWAHAWQWVAVPLAGAVVHRVQLTGWFGSDEVFVVLLAVMLALGHLWFWLTAWRGRQNVASFTAGVLMLLFYGLLAGILVARVSQYGSDYLWQPRYSIIYRWHLVALCLMLLGQLAGKDPTTIRGTLRDGLVGKLVAGVFVAGLVLVQIPLSIYAWEELVYVQRYHQRQARQIGELARAPASPPDSCIAGLVVCRFPLEHRIELLDFLREQRLNIFSPAFQARHHMTPAPESG